jgi:site-specific DNA-methyltransferase (adenine-specific)
MPEFTLYNGDCLEVMKDLSANSIDLIICDLPYGCLSAKALVIPNTENKYRKAYAPTERKACAWDIPLDLEAFWKEVKRVRKQDNTPTLHFATTKFGYDLIESNKKEFRYDLVWDKKNGVSFLSANKMPMRSHEMIYVFSKAGAYYKRVDISGNFKAWESKKEKAASPHYGAVRTPGGNAEGQRCPLTVIQFPRKNRPGLHPTEKPLELYKFLIERYCPPGGTVLDPTFGSCNSGRAAEALGRNYIGIEKDESFFKKAVKSIIGDP